MTRSTKHSYLSLIHQWWQRFGITLILMIILLALLSRYISYHRYSTGNIEYKINQQTQINQAQQQANKRLQQQVKAVDNLEILESEARYRLGLLKPGETYYQY